jgi:2-keto-4-pentenoate hydratase/2-oxohepta-3-ene-1,7-dioic acid hydratase in catechol pathway
MSATVKTSTVRVVRFAADGGPRYGILEGDAIHALEGDLFGEFRQGKVLREAREARLLPPVEPSKVILVGYNYLGHAEELKKLQPEDPLVFLKAPSALIGSGADVVYPRDAQNVSYEAELVVVLGRRCAKVSPEEAPEYVLGYTCGNDITDRDLQKKDVQYARAKSFDTFGPIGPCIAVGLNPDNLRIVSRLNGEVRQQSNTGLLIHSAAKLVSWTSHAMTLNPGDVIYTGTPKGVGLIKPGDTMEVEIEGIGVLKNRVVAEGAAAT